MYSLPLLLSLPLLAVGQQIPRPYPLPDAHLHSTSLLDHASYLDGFDDQQWYLDNLPFVDLPDRSMQDVYYYRASVIKRHVKWVHEGHGFVETEFIHPVSWASKFQTIPDSAPHHMVEMRWLRNPNYVKNHIEAYTRGGVEKLTGITFTHYIHRAILEHAQTTGDIPFLVSQLEGMIETYHLFNTTRDNTTGLYYRTPLQDAQEYSLPGYLVGGPGGGPLQEWDDFGLSSAMGGGNDYGLVWSGPDTYRPSFNAYMIAGARAIAEVAALAGNDDLADTWKTYGDDLYTEMEDQLYSHELNFWIDVVQGTNYRCQGRELIGMYPYRFDVGTNETYISGLEAVLTPEHFLTEFGPTTLEQTNPYYTAFKNSTYCCMWNGQSWPFSTSVYLQTLAKIARDGKSDIVTSELFNQELQKYVRTNYKDGVPYTAESHYPTIDMWSGDGTNHSEHYLHSTFIDNIFTNLFGVVPTFGDTLVLQPLIPSNWSYFAIENLPYHGTLLSMVWDQDGSHYGNGSAAGFSIYSNGSLFHHQASLGAVNVSLPFNTTNAAQQLAQQLQWQNILANPNSPHGLPLITSDYSLNPQGDNALWPAWKLNDGLLWYDTTPDNFWTNNQSQIPYSTINITLPRARRISSLSLAILADRDRGGVVDCPDGIRITDGKGGTVVFKKPWTECVPNALNTVFFSDPDGLATANSSTEGTGFEIETDFLQVTLSDKLRYTTAVSEIQIWVPPNEGPRYEVEDGVLGTYIGSFEGRATGTNSSIEDGGVRLGSGGWVEIAGVRTGNGEAGRTDVTVVGGGSGTVEVQLNWLRNETVMFDGVGNKTVVVDMLRGGNVVTILQTEGRPWVDAIVIGS